jgi:hypothetical protein
MSVTVRPARPGDGAAIAEVWLSAAAYYADLDPANFQVPRAVGLADGWEEQLGQDNGNRLRLVAEADGRVIGWLAARTRAARGECRRAVDPRAQLDPARRGRPGRRPRPLAPRHRDEAAGSREAWGADRGALVARLDTYAYSPVSVPFYEDRMGYQRRSIVFQKRLRSP